MIKIKSDGIKGRGTKESAYFRRLASTNFKENEITIAITYEDEGMTEIDYKTIKNFMRRLKRKGKNPRYTITAGAEQIISRNLLRP